MGAVGSADLPVDAHNALVRGLGSILRGQALGPDEVELRAFLPQIYFQIVQVTFVKELVRAKLLVATQALSPSYSLSALLIR